MMDRADLHTHSTISDGADSPSKMVEMAANLGLGGISLNDHDTLDGLEEFMNAPVTRPIVRVPAVEISAEFLEKSVHLLGFFVPKDNARLDSELKKLSENRKARFSKMVARVRDLGINPSDDYLRTLMDDVESLGRPHIGKMLIDHGIVQNMDEAFEKFLYRGGPLYIKKERIQIDDGIRLLRSCGAVPIIAHPLDMQAPSVEERLREFKEMGAMGAEVNYDYSHLTIDEDPKIVEHIVRKLGLIGTGGTDYHGGNWRVPIGTINVSLEIVDELKSAAMELGNDLNSWDT